MRCIVSSCDVDFNCATTEGVTFVAFPADQTVCQAWLKSLQTKGCKLTEDSVVCSRHFQKDDLYISREGQWIVRPGAIPVIFVQNTPKNDDWTTLNECKVCRICFASNCNLYPMTKCKKLDEAYEILTGLSIEESDNLPPYLCTECSYRLLNFIKFRTRTIEASLVLQDIIEKQDHLTIEAITSYNKHKQFSSNLTVSHIYTDHFDLDIKHVEKENESEEHTQAEYQSNLVIIKVEKDDSQDSSSNATFPPKLHEVIIPGIKLEKDDEYGENSVNIENTSNDVKELPGSHESMGVRVKVETIDMPDYDDGEDNTDGIPFSDVSTGGHYPSENVYLEELPRVKLATQNHINVNTGKTYVRKYTGKKIYSCDVCKKGFTKKYNLAIHLRIHTGIRPYSCDLCKQGFSVKCDLVNHLRKHTGEKPFECNICKKTFILKNVLQAHMRTHTGEKPFACTQCDKVFTQRANLSAHIKIHSGEKPYSCDICNKGFSQRCNLITHTRIHSGEKPYSCKLCPISFSRNYHLQSHLKVHTGEKPYTCEVCNKAFTSQSNVQKHMTVHSGEKPYKCNVCDRAFNRKGNLNTHIKTHSDEKPFICVVCNKGFRRKDQLKIHRKVHSSEKPVGNDEDQNIQE